MLMCYVYVAVTGRRHLFSMEYLGIENFKRERMETAERFGSTKGVCNECGCGNYNYSINLYCTPTN